LRRLGRIDSFLQLGGATKRNLCLNLPAIRIEHVALASAAAQRRTGDEMLHDTHESSSRILMT